MLISNNLNQNLKKYRLNEHGVTLIEIMVYMVIAGILLAVAVTTFLGQNASYNRQDVVAEIQQNVRGATEMMVADIHLAGYGHFFSGGSAFSDATQNSFTINYEIDGVEETVTYELDGSALVRNEEPIADNIEYLLFEYMVENGGLDWTITPAAADYDNIRAVKIIVRGMARGSAFNQTDTASYVPPLDGPDSPTPAWVDPAPGTGYRRMVSLIAQCRNNGG